MNRWWELFTRLGRAVLELVAAEIEALTADLQQTGRQLGRAVAWVVAAVAVLFWAVGALVYALIALLARVVSVPAAAFLVAATLVGVAVLMGWLAARWMRSIESPAATLRRRLEDQGEWWQSRVLEPTSADLDRDEDDDSFA